MSPEEPEQNSAGGKVQSGVRGSPLTWRSTFRRVPSGPATSHTRRALQWPACAYTRVARPDSPGARLPVVRPEYRPDRRRGVGAASIRQVLVLLQGILERAIE